MALPIPGFYTSTGGIITTHDFGSVEAGEYKPGSTGWPFRFYNAYGSTTSDTMTSVKMSIRGSSGGTDDIWVQQHWVQLKSSSGSTGVVDDAQTVFTAVGKNKELSLGDIPSGEYRTLYARCYPPTDAAEQDVDFQLRATYQDPSTSICNWITGLRGNGVVASTGDPFAMSTGGSTGTIPYEAGYALINNNEIYYGSSGNYTISTTTGTGIYNLYLTESGTFSETTGTPASNELLLYEATYSTGECTALADKRVYLAGLQAGTTGAMPSNPDKGDLYIDTTNGIIYGAKTSTGWTALSGTTFLSLTDTPADFTGDASKILAVTTGEDAVEFVSSTGITLDSFGTPSTGTALNATTGRHGLLLEFSGTTGEYLSATGGWDTPTGVDTFTGLTDTPADYTGDASKILVVTTGEDAVEFISTTGIALDNLGTPSTGTTLDSSTGRHGLLMVLDGNTSNYLRGDGAWQPPPGATGGEANTASNANTTGVGVFYQKSGIDLQFKGMHSTGDILVTDSTGTHTINLDVISTGIALDNLGTPSTGVALDSSTGKHGLLIALDGSTGNYLRGDGSWQPPPGATGGEANTASNVNTTGVGVFEGKVGVDLQFKGIRAGSPKVTVTDSTGTHTISIDLSGVVTSSGAFTVNYIPQISSTGGVIKASPFLVTTGDVFDFGAHSAGFTEQAIATTTGTASINWNSGLKALFTRSTGSAGAVTFSFTAPVKSANLMLTVRGSTAGSTGTVTWPAVKWDGGSAPSLGSGASAINVASFYYSTGLTSYLGQCSTGTFSS